LLRVFREDLLVCSCGGRRVVIAFITEKKAVTEILEHLGLPTTGPPIAAARSDTPDQDLNGLSSHFSADECVQPCHHR
jgi:hypothetical protein